MGLLDGMLGNVLGAALGGNRAQTQSQDPLSSILGGLSGGSGATGSGGGNLVLQLALAMLQRNGGLEGVLGKFRQAGMGAQADSWVSTGQNMDVSSDQLQQVRIRRSRRYRVTTWHVAESGRLGDVADATRADQSTDPSGPSDN